MQRRGARDHDQRAVPCTSGRARPTSSGAGATRYIGPATLDAISGYLAVSGHAAGPLFRRVLRGGHGSSEPLGADGIRGIVRKRVAAVPGSGGRVGGHSFRVGSARGRAAAGRAGGARLIRRRSTFASRPPAVRSRAAPLPGGPVATLSTGQVYLRSAAAQCQPACTARPYLDEQAYSLLRMTGEQTGTCMYKRPDSPTRRVDLSGAQLRDADLHEVSLYDADLTNADLTNANLTGADLHGAVLSGAVLRGANLQGAKLRAVDMSNADLTDADLRDARLNRGGRGGSGKSPRRPTSLKRARLTRANLSGADLRRVDLHSADLTDATLVGANLRGVGLHLASLYGADLTGADLTGAVLSGATYNAKTRWPVGFEPPVATA